MNKETPLVSVSVVTYNHKDYIEQCLNGILMQETTFPFEIILGEDESHDGTREICIDYANKYPDKIKLFLRSRKDVIYINGNPTGRYNMIENLKACKGKYIALCEGDDYWTDPLKLQKQVDFLEANSDYAICFHEAKVLFEKPWPYRVTYYKDFKWNVLDENKTVYNVDKVFHGPFMATASVVFRVPKNFSIPNWFVEVQSGDIVLSALVTAGNKIKYLSESMSVYRKHIGGVTEYHKGNSIILNRLLSLKYLNNYFNNQYIVEIKRSAKSYILNDLKYVSFKEYLFLLKLYFTSNVVNIKWIFKSIKRDLKKDVK
ncbi:glycosyltransferase family 2 protein [Mangrovimonas spongiae]|uniref:Glycosyltransferase family 2 protein n=1 Tax=Mangrovimonas spongiae TaxID=2494697 RepID=A0A3R9NPB4_9FLAO|nr:glycosyltransferase family A protein [Mangrovimonas spongiae]RSK40517.1 glycosyltransferase family 2 protein [Mangrovimonas spongiae]